MKVDYWMQCYDVITTMAKMAELAANITLVMSAHLGKNDPIMVKFGSAIMTKNFDQIQTFNSDGHCF